MSSEHSFVMQRTKNTSVEFQELNDIGVYPTEGIFKNYEKGIEYQMYFLIKNESSKMTTLRISQPTSTEFHIPDFVPKKSIAPGLDMALKVVFCADEEKNFHDSIEISTDNCSISIPLQATIPTPEISIPTMFDLGTIVAQPIASQYFELRNDGDREGSFTFTVEETGNVTITPKIGSIARKSIQKIRVEMKGLEVAGVHRSTVKLKLDNDRTERAILVSCKVVEGRLEIMHHNRENVVNNIVFSSLYYGQKSITKTILYNNSPSKMTFSFRHLEDDNDDFDSDDEESPRPSMSVSHARGVLGPFGQQQIEFHFHPISRTKVKGFKSASSGQNEKFDVIQETIVLNVVETGQETVLALKGKAIHPDLQFSSKKFVFGDCPVNEYCDIMATVTNCVELPIAFNTSRIAHFRCTPSQGVLQPFETRNFTFTFNPRQLGHFQSVMHFSLGGGLMKIPLYLDGMAERSSLSKTVGILGGIDKLDQDFVRKPNYVHAKLDTDASSSAGLSRSFATRPTFEIRQETMFESEASMKAYQEYLKRKDNEKVYNDFLKQSRQQKEFAIKLLQLDQLKSFVNEVDLGMEPGAGLTSPKPVLRLQEEKLFIQDQFKGFTTSTMFKKNVKFDEDKIVIKKFKPHPTTPNEIKDCQMKLTNKLIRNITYGPKFMDFGKQGVFSEKIKNLGVRNNLKQYIQVSVLDSENDEIKIVPKSQVIPPLCTTGFDICLCAQRPQKIHHTLVLLINDHAKIRCVVSAEVIPLDVVLSVESLKFRFNEYDLEQSTTETITITNKGTATAVFNWNNSNIERDKWPQLDSNANSRYGSARLSNPTASSEASMDRVSRNMGVMKEQIRNLAEHDSAQTGRSYPEVSVKQDSGSVFEIVPTSGSLDPNRSLLIDVIFTPGSIFRAQQQFFLNVKGSDTPKILTCIGDVEESKVICVEKRLEYGVLPVGLGHQKVLTLRNTGDTAAVFKVFSADSDFKTHPTKGRIPKGSSQKLLVEVCPSFARQFDSYLDIIIRGGKPLKIPLRGESKIPAVEILSEEPIHFGSTFIGRMEKRQMQIHNIGGNVAAVLYLDFTEYEDFMVMNTRGEIITETSDGNDSIIVLPHVRSDNEMSDDDDDEIYDEIGSQGQSKKKIMENDALVGDEFDERAGEESAGNRYQLTVSPNTSLSFFIIFKPTSVHEYDFKIPLQLAGMETQFSQRVVACALKPRVVVMHPIVDFGQRVVVKEDGNIPHRKFNSFTNEDGKELFWELGSLPHEFTNVFRVEPKEGSLLPGHSAQIQVFFSPNRLTNYEVSVPLFLDGQREKAYAELNLRGHGSKPAISFDRKEIVLSVVPLNTPVSEIFFIINEGFEHLELNYRLPLDKEKVPLKLSFLEGSTLSRENTQLPLEISFISDKPISFTANVDFFDDAGNVYSVAVTCTADNCLFTNYPFIFGNKDKYRFEAGSSNKAIVFVETNDSKPGHRSDASPLHSDRSGKTFTSYSSYAPTSFSAASAISTNEANRRKMFNKRSARRLLGWLNMSILRNPVDDLVKAIQFSDGAIMYEIIASLSGKTPPGRPFQLPRNKIEACRTLVAQYEELLLYLRQQGALFHDIKALSLLKYEDYLRLVSLQNQQSAVQGEPHRKDAGSSLDTNCNTGAKRMTERRFRYISYEAWLTIIYQVVKIYVLNSISLSGFRQLPGLDKELEIVDPTLSQSNVFSVPESILLKWMTLHYNKIFGQEQESDQPYRVIGFGGAQLNNSKAFAALFMSHIPNSRKRFGTLLNNPRDVTDYEHNASLITSVLKESQLDYDIGIKDIVRANPLDMLLFCIFLYHNLPQFVPKTTIVFEGGLLEKIEKVIELSNPTKKTIEYSVSLEKDGAMFNIPKDRITLGPNGKETFIIDITPRFVKTIESNLLFQGKRVGTFKPATMVFGLKTVVQTSHFVKTFEVSSVLFEPAKIEVAVENPFDTNAQFTVSFEQTCSASNAGELPDAFWTSTENINIKKSEKKMLSIQFLPFSPGANYQCKILFSDNKIGEFLYLVRGTCQIPLPIEEHKILTEASSVEHIQIPLKVTNPEVDRALHLLRERLKKSKFGSSANTNIPDPNQIDLQVSINSPYFNGPSEITIWRKPNPNNVTQNDKPVIPITFHPKDPGAYECLVTLQSAFDYRVFKLSAKVRSEGMKAELEFSSPVRQRVVQEIPLTNHSDRPWKIQASLEGDAFSGPVELRVPQGKSVPYPLTFYPRKMNTYSGKLILDNPDTLERYIYELIGVADDPLSESTINLECTAREAISHSITVHDIQSDPQDFNMRRHGSTMDQGTVLKTDSPMPTGTNYNISIDLPFVSGASSLFIERGKSAEFTLSVSPSTSGEHTGSITFTDPHTGEYIWHLLQIKAKRPPAEGHFEIVSVIRESKIMEIEVTNPLNHPTLFDVVIEGEGLHGDSTVQVGPQGVAKYKLTFFPLRTGTQQAGSISFNNEIGGEFWYSISTRCSEALTLEIPKMQCEIGRTVWHQLTIQNPIDLPIILTIDTSNSQNFQVTPATLPLHGFQTGTFSIQYLPSSISVSEEAIIRAFSSHVGSWTYHCRGIGLEPTEMEWTTIYSQVKGTQSAMLTWRNPFSSHRRICVTLQSKSGSVNKQKLTDGIFSVISRRFHNDQTFIVSPFGTAQIPISFSPISISDYHAIILVTIVGEENITWRYPVQGITEVQTGEVFDFTAQSRTSVEKYIETTLVGVPIQESGFMTMEESSNKAPSEPTSSARSQQHPPKFTFSIDFPDDHPHIKAMRRSLSLTMVEADIPDMLSTFEPPKSPSSMNEWKKLRFKAEFGPLRPFTGFAELHVHRSTGGMWKFEIQMESQAPPEVDDVIDIHSAIGRTEQVSFRLTNIFAHQTPFKAYFTPETPLDFMVRPMQGKLASFGYEGTQFIVSYTASNYGKVAQGILVIDTEEMQWRYEVKGILPRYTKPDKTLMGSRIENRLRKDVEKSLGKRSGRNFLQENIMRQPAVPKSGTGERRSGTTPSGDVRRVGSE